MRNPEIRTRLAPAPSSADVGIVMAMPIEAGHLFDGLTKVRKYSARALTITEGEAGGKIVAVILGGIGRSAARRATDVLIAGHRPRWLISAGFGGALDPSLHRNDLLVPEMVVEPGGTAIEVDVPFASIPGVRRPGGRLLTLDRIVQSAAEKAQLRQSHRADVLDMETIAVASHARERSIPFLAVRVVSDDATEDLPREVASLLTQSGSYRIGAAMRAIWNRPTALKDFWTLHARALESADALAACLLKVIAGLPQT